MPPSEPTLDDPLAVADPTSGAPELTRFAPHPDPIAAMSHRTPRIGYAAALLAVWAGCGIDDAAPPGPPPEAGVASVRIVNRGQKALSMFSAHLDAEHLNPDYPMGHLDRRGEQLFYESGAWHFTMVRARYLGGPEVALTTERPVVLVPQNGYLVELLDQAFRIREIPFEATPEADRIVFGRRPTATSTASGP